MEEIHTRSQIFGFPSAPSISASIGAVAGSIPMCSKVLIFACPARVPARALVLASKTSNPVKKNPPQLGNHEEHEGHEGHEEAG